LPEAEASRGTWFDPAVGFRDPEGEALTSEVLSSIAAVEKRSRRRREEDQQNHQAIVRAILANGLRCDYYRRPPLVAYGRAAESYGDGPLWLSGRAMSRTVDLLVDAGLLRASVGKWRSRSSTYGVTDRLRGVAEACGITNHSFTVRLPPKRLVRLRQGDSRTPLVAFAQTGETIRWAGRLWAYNAFLAQQDIGLALTAEEEADWVRHWHENREGEGVSLSRPELIQTDLYRQFNNGSFGEGGRLYGGWWINTPEPLRRKITINGQPTVELDFSGCAIRMLYHERGLDYQDDPYQLAAVEAHEAAAGLPPGHFREGVKAITQALINDDKGGKPERIPLPNRLSFRPRFKRAEVRHLIEAKHAPIGDAFGTGAGLRLQRSDSDLALAIVVDLMDQNIVALPIHDSFVVAASAKEPTIAVMNSRYQRMFGFPPMIH
jgi:hypothetical protein